MGAHIARLAGRLAQLLVVPVFLWISHEGDVKADVGTIRTGNIAESASEFRPSGIFVINEAPEIHPLISANHQLWFLRERVQLCGFPLWSDRYGKLFPGPIIRCGDGILAFMAAKPFAANLDHNRRPASRVFDDACHRRDFAAFAKPVHAFGLDYFEGEVGNSVHGVSTGSVSGGFASQIQSAGQKGRAEDDKNCRPESVLGHPLGGVIHRLCRRVHPLLGGKVGFLAVAGFGLAALAGLGLGLILDNFNRERKWKRLGWALLLLCFPLGLLGLLPGPALARY